MDAVQHRKSIFDDPAVEGNKIIKCSCGAEWIITHLEFAAGADKFDQHIIKETGQNPREYH